jgi:hypothetical protein
LDDLRQTFRELNQQVAGPVDLIAFGSPTPASQSADDWPG